MGPQNTANLWIALCEDLQAQRQSAEAIQHHTAAKSFVEAAKKVFQARPKRLADALEIAGDVHSSAEGPELAKESYEEALSISLEEKNLSACIRILTKLAALHDKLGEFPEAAKTYLHCVNLTEESRDVSHLAALLNNLAGLEKRLGKFSDAEAHYRRAIEIASTIHGENHPELASLLNNYGVFQTEQDNVNEAENLHLRALGIREKAFGANHPEVARSLHNLAVVYQARGDFKNAKSYYEAARTIFQRHLDMDDIEIQSLMENYQTLPAA